jgi:c-di-AMP phosphodiesterase-like protein
MKSKLIVLSIALVGALTTLASFQYKSKALATGTLTVQIKMPAPGLDMDTAPVSIALTKEALDEGDYLTMEGTDAKGVANFSQVAPGTYYIDAVQIIDETYYYGEGTAVVTAGKNTLVTIELSEDDLMNEGYGDEEEE